MAKDYAFHGFFKSTYHSVDRLASDLNQVPGYSVLFAPLPADEEHHLIDYVRHSSRVFLVMGLICATTSVIAFMCIIAFLKAAVVLEHANTFLGICFSIGGFIFCDCMMASSICFAMAGTAAFFYGAWLAFLTAAVVLSEGINTALDYCLGSEPGPRLI